MQYKIITPVSTEPVTITEAKSHLRVDFTEDDSLILSLITVAREFCENYTNRALATQTLELILDEFPYSRLRFLEYIDLPMSPVQSITSVSYKDSTGANNTWSNYVLNNDTLPAILTPMFGYLWPSFEPYPTGAVRIRYVSGHTPADIPVSIKQAMLLLIGHLYENREATSATDLKEVPFSVKALLNSYRVWVR